MFLLLEEAPDTFGYMILGYAFFSVVMIAYVASMYVRNRNLKRDLETLESIQAEEAKPTKRQ
ncbi:MAG: hypothetical protein PHQ36_01060 [Anaerolineales bacterium]|nr:hypothetical protein [Anaerolineales bacterium]